MRISGRQAALLAGLVWAVALTAQGPAAEAQSTNPPATTCANPKAWGVSRTVEIDTSTGPRFGFQYKDQPHDLLQDGEIVLTFDDGPLRSHTRPVLNALDAECLKATFFLVGRMALSDPEMVREYARRGHTVGTHTWSHANLKALPLAKARAEIELGFSAVQQAMGRPIAPFFRFPYLADGTALGAYVRSRHIAAFSIDADSKDYMTRDPGTVHRRVLAELARAKKGIILFHDIQPSTARALPGLLAALKAKGYRVVHFVPKADVATVAEFDAQAQQMFAKRAVASGAHPLAGRALTWPHSAVTPAQPAAAQPGATQSGPAPATDPAQVPQGKPPRVQATPDKPDWVTKLW